MKTFNKTLVALLISQATMYQADDSNLPQISDDEVIVITSLRQKLEQDGRLKDVIQKTEVLDELNIEHKNALSLTDALAHEPGVRISNECSMCGVKRIMLNGMKGDHTTILVDGLPAHTLISGFYAVDSIPTTGIEAIEIARGAGASLIAPEAIGGTINIVTKSAYENALEFDVAAGNYGFRAYKMNATGTSDDNKTGITLSAQYDVIDQEDDDNNGVSESPALENQSFTAMISHDVNDTNHMQFRISNVVGEIFGGPMLGSITSSIGATLAGFDDDDSANLFVNDDVRQAYIGKPWETAEWINTKRDEAYIKWLTEISSSLAAEFAYSSAEHIQDSFYEGIDYYAKDEMDYVRAKFDMELTNTHFLTFGADIRREKMRSKTNALQNLPDYVSDSFDYETAGIFLKDTWTPTSELEIAMALRFDNVEADFVDPEKPGVEIDESIVSPRVDARYFHSPELSSRLSAGRGYRAPLSFFETDHGILDSELGYQIDVNELELSKSITYTLSYEGEQLSVSASAARSVVENLASLEENEFGVPLLTQLDSDASVTTVDVVAGYQINEQWIVNGSIENFSYDDDFKSSYAIAPIEERMSIELNWVGEQLDIFLSTSWYGSRDLTEYGYEGFDIAGAPSSIKTTIADSFIIMSLKASYHMSDSSELYFGANNLTDETQIANGVSPLFYDSDGGYDVGYIYGSLRGREIYVGYKVHL